MSHFHSIDEMVSAQVANMLDKHVNHPDTNIRLKHEIYEEMSEQFRGLSAFYRRVTVDKFMTRPAKLSDGSCLVLLNFDLPSTSNAYKLIVNASDREQYKLTVFQENSRQLGNTVFVKLWHREEAEVYRQINSIREAIGPDNFKIPAIFTLMHIPKEIEGYEYAPVPVDEKKQLSAEEFAVTEVATPEVATPAEQKRRGPTPLILQSRTCEDAGSVIQSGNTTTFFRP